MSYTIDQNMAPKKGDGLTDGLTLEFSQKAYDRLQEINKLIGSKDNAATVRKGLQVLGWLVKQTNDGWRLQLVKEDTVREVELNLETD